MNSVHRLTLCNNVSEINYLTQYQLPSVIGCFGVHLSTIVYRQRLTANMTTLYLNFKKSIHTTAVISVEKITCHLTGCSQSGIDISLGCLCAGFFWRREVTSRKFS